MIHLGSTFSPNGEGKPIQHDLSQPTIDKIDEYGIMTIDGAYIEFKEIYAEREPYTAIQTLPGLCYQWDQTFIYLLQLAMSTDSMENMTEDEKRAWYYFVNFQNYHTHSALTTDANGAAIGCTIPDENNISYVVAEDGEITTTRCQPPGYEVEGEDIWRSLDYIFMSLYLCRDIDNCQRDDTIEDISPCPVD